MKSQTQNEGVQMASGKSKNIVYPPADDQMNLYNAVPGMGRELWALAHPREEPQDPYTYINTVPDPGPIDDDYAIKEDGYEIISAYLKSIEFPMFTEQGYCICDEYSLLYRGEVNSFLDPIDRTIEMEVIEPTMFTVEFLRHIQSSVLEKYPLWRIHIIGYVREGESSLMVYPDAICVGEKCCPPNDLEDELAAWRANIQMIREKKHGHRLRQIRAAKLLTKANIEELSAERVAVVAAFDNCNGNYEQHAIWIIQPLIRGEKFGLVSPRAIGGGTDLRAAADGEAPVRDRSKAAFHLFEYGIPAAEVPRELVFRKTGYSPERGPFIHEDGPEIRLRYDKTLTDAEVRNLLNEIEK